MMNPCKVKREKGLKRPAAATMMARSFRACNSGWHDKFFSLLIQRMVEVKLVTVLLGVTFAAGKGRRFWFCILFARRYGFSSSLGLYLSRCGIEALLFVLVYWLVQVVEASFYNIYESNSLSRGAAATPLGVLSLWNFTEMNTRLPVMGLIELGLEDESLFVVVMQWVAEARRNVGPFCYCGMKCVVRTARTVKNRGKQFWGSPKFNNGGEDGYCNYFTWCADHGVVETETIVKSEGKFESLLNREAMEVGWKIISDLDLSVKKLGNRLNVFLGVVCVLVVLVLVNIIVDMNDFIVVLIECT
ncbi:hypothetical protein V8G54_024453 [Vigna mungo]|uniref:GRF-type domain-containing protein n=1 Tax=Vigna mungo TaxID=3915 RepID=A0AAQ3RRB2_VIGMU